MAGRRVTEKKDKAEVWRIGTVPVKVCTFRLRDGSTLCGEVVGVTKYEVVVRPISPKSEHLVVLYKHAIDYVEVVK